jgi:hypothetical protein
MLTRSARARLVPFVEETGALVSLLVWLAFGAIAVAVARQGLASVVFALLVREEIGQPAASQAVAVITVTGFQRGTRCTPTRRGTGAVARYHLPGMNRCAGAPA